MKPLYAKYWLASLLLVFTCTLRAQKQQLTEEQVVTLNSLSIVHQPMRVKCWLSDSKALLIVPSNSKLGEEGKLMVADAKKKMLVPYVESDYVAIYEPHVLVKDYALYLINSSNDTVKFKDLNDEVTNPTLSPDGTYLAFTCHNDLYTYHIADRKETRLTFDGSDVLLNGYASWTYMEEILGRATKYRAFWWSPDSKHIAYFRSDDSQTPLFTITEADGQHGRVETLRYPKAGDEVTKVKVGIVKPTGGEPVFADFSSSETHYFGKPEWRTDGKALWVQWMNRGQDKLKLYEVSLENGSKKELYNEEQKTWISIDTDDRIQLLQSGSGFILQSDKSGWNHLYLHDMSGKLINSITTGDFSVKEVLHVDEKRKVVYFICQKDNIAFNDLYKVSLDGKELQRLTFGEYNHNISLSPKGDYFITTYSSYTTPAVVAMYNNSGKQIFEVENCKGKDFDTYELPKVELVRVKSKDGNFDLPMRVILPLDMQSGKKYPVIVSTYGGPNAPRLRGGWSLTNSQCWYAKEGVIQVTLDHRGSGHFGKIGMDYLHRSLGYWEMEDFKQCVKWLIDNAQADANKVCITGFSYGGYLSCYALGYAPEVFTHAIAGGSVTDWLLYDAPYTERFMDLPQENPDGYKSSSVLTHLSKMKGKLLVYHGEIDENVHVQNTIQLVSEMQNLGKYFEMMIFPSVRHGWRGVKRDYENRMRMEFIYNHFLEKPIPDVLKTAESAVGAAGSY